MVLATTGGSITRAREIYRETDDISVAVKLVVTVLVTVVTIGMVVQASKDNGTAGTATCSCTKRIQEECTIGSQSVHIGCLNGFISITSKVGALVIGHEEDDVLGSSRGPNTIKKEYGENSNHDRTWALLKLKKVKGGGNSYDKTKCRLLAVGKNTRMFAAVFVDLLR